MKVVCVFPAHRRPHITTETIQMLSRQTVKPHVIMVGDSCAEAEIADETGCEYVQYPNRPLSSKWQAGIWRAGDYNPDAVLIIGSDVWLTPNWCETYLSYLGEYDVVGSSEWYILHLGKENIRIAHHSYKGPRSIEPIGMGRMYSRAAMRRMGWVLYRERKNSRADGIAMRRVQRTNCTVGVFNEPGVMAMEIRCPRWLMIHKCEHLQDNRNLVEYPDVYKPGVWLQDNFPGSLKAMRRLRKRVW